MTIAPIYDSMTKARALIIPALRALSGAAGVYWALAPQNTARPYVIAQSQDNGGMSVSRLGSQGWSGLITVKAVADSLAAADALLALVAPGMDALSAPVGYDLSVQFVRPVAIPPENGNIWQSGLIFEIQLERE